MGRRDAAVDGRVARRFDFTRQGATSDVTVGGEWPNLMESYERAMERCDVAVAACYTRGAEPNRPQALALADLMALFEIKRC